MRIKQQLKTFLMFGALGLLLVGCTNQNNGSNTGNNPPIDQTIRLQFWGVFLDKDVIDPLIAEYRVLNPNVEITYENRWPGGNRSIATGVYKTNLERVLNTNDPDQIPDLFMAENTWAGNYDSRYTAPAPASVIDAATVNAQFYDAVTTDFVTNGSVNGLPLWMDTLAIIYNKDLLAKEAVTTPPTDWVGFRNLAQSLTKRSGTQITQAGFGAGTANNLDFGVPLLYSLLFQNGVRMVDDSGNPVFANDSDTSSAFQFYLNFAKSTSVGSWNNSLPNDSISFLEGDTAMIVAPSWRYQDLLFFNDTYNLGIDMGVSPLPQIDPQNSRNWATYWGVMVARNRPNSTESWRFLSWLTQKEQLRKLRANDAAKRRFGFLYPRKDMQSELSLESVISVFNNSLTHARSWYMVDGTKVEPLFKNMILEEGEQNEISAGQSEVRDVIESKGLLLR